MKGHESPIEFPDDTGPGMLLRRAREAANRSVGEMSTALHLDPKTVEALEADSFDRLPAPTFVRGYMHGYARALGLPPEPILEAYDRRGFEPPPLLPPDYPEASRTRISDLAIRLMTYAVGAMLALLVVLWWDSQGFTVSDIGADLIGWVSDTAPDPARAAAEGPVSGVARHHSGERDAASTEAAGELPGSPQGVGFAADPRLLSDEVAGAAGTPPERGGPATSAPRSEGAAAESSPGDDAGAAGAPPERESPATPAPRSEGAAAEPPPGENAAASGTTTGIDTPASAASRSEAASQAGSDAVDRGNTPARDGNGLVDPSSGPDDTALPAMTPATIPETPPSRTPPSAPDGTAAPTRAASETAQSRLVLGFTHESWVEIYDGKKARLFFGLVRPGRVLDLAGAPPFDILIGFAKDVRVTLDGVPFDYAPHVRHGVARFSLGAPPGRGGDATDSPRTSE